MKRILLTVLVMSNQMAFSSNDYAQIKINIIFFYAPYTGAIETNQYEIPSVKFNFFTQYNNIKNANVEYELANAIAHHDYKFVAISGVAYLYPGVKYGPNLKKYKSKVIVGTSDAINLSDPPLQTVAYNFAKSYNQLLSKEIAKIEHQHKR